MTNFQLNKMSKNFYAALNSKPSVMTKQTILKPTNEKDDFETLNVRKSKWTPPEGQFVSLDHGINQRLLFH